MKELLKRLFSIEKEILVDKDPNDYTLTNTSTAWEVDNYCRECKNSVSINERLASICNSCGTYNHYMVLTRPRSRRQIFQNEKWVWQYKYPSGDVEILENKYN